MSLKNSIKKVVPTFVKRAMYKAGIYEKFIPPPGKIDMGDMNRTKPFDFHFGWKRGGPIDRYYIENFLNENKSAIKGRVLEIGENSYTLHYGGDKIEKSDILHVNDSNPNATYVGDLSHAPQLPDNAFDCFIFTQTLHLIYDYKEAIRTCFRILKPGGVLLMTVPGISQITSDEWENYWLWSFTEASMKRVLAEVFSPQQIEVHSFGNVLVASSFLYGVGARELRKEQLDQKDSHYQLLITAKAIK